MSLTPIAPLGDSHRSLCKMQCFRKKQHQTPDLLSYCYPKIRCLGMNIFVLFCFRCLPGATGKMCDLSFLGDLGLLLDLLLYVCMFGLNTGPLRCFQRIIYMFLVFYANPSLSVS